MATTERYQTASGATAYMARWRTPSGTQSKKRGFATKRDAEDYANTVETDKLSGMLESAYKVHVGPAWGSTPVADIDVLGIETWIATMGSKGARATTVLRA